MHRSGGRQYDKPLGAPTKAIPWWKFPTPLGAPKIQNAASPCWSNEFAGNEGAFLMPVPCVGFPPGHNFDGAYWQSWFSGP